MVKFCPVCEMAFKNDDDTVAIIRTSFKEIPSLVAFALAKPTEVFEINHYECAKGDLIPWDDEPDDTEE